MQDMYPKYKQERHLFVLYISGGGVTAEQQKQRGNNLRHKNKNNFD
jgi:hypothetical protein